jgi:hypothetical protein
MAGALGLGIVVSGAASSRAQEHPSQMSMEAFERDDPNGLKLSEVLTKGLFGLAREVFTPSDTAELNHAQPAASGLPPRGLQFDLFTPGDFGVTVHYHW